jgi:hypothetical protein
MRRIGQRPLQAHGCWRLKAGFQCKIETTIRHISTGVVPLRAATLMTRPIGTGGYVGDLSKHTDVGD